MQADRGSIGGETGLKRRASESPRARASHHRQTDLLRAWCGGRTASRVWFSWPARGKGPGATAGWRLGTVRPRGGLSWAQS